MKILLGCNLLSSVNPIAHTDHVAAAYRLGRDTDWEVLVNFAQRMSIDNMRNQSGRVAVLNNCDYLVFLDDDVLIPDGAIPNLIKRMEATGAKIGAGLVYVRGYPFEPMAFKEITAQLENGEEAKGLTHLTYQEIDDKLGEAIECEAIGFSLAAIKVDLLKEMEPPYFITGPNCTEDVYFCIKARKHFPDVKIILDTAIECTHIVYNYGINHKNHGYVKEFERNVFKASDKNSDFDPATIRSSREAFAGSDS